MIKKKRKSKSIPKTAKKKKNARKHKKDLNPAEVRKDIAQMVDLQAATMAQAVIDEGKKGQLATVKYLFEMAEIFPGSTDGSQATQDEESLAKTLLRRLDLPDEPVVRDEEDRPPNAGSSAEKGAAKPAADSGLEPESAGESKDSLVV
jgi:hypothetical protein